MERIPMRSTANHRYDGEMLAPGDQFMAKPHNVAGLRALRRAVVITESPVIPNAPQLVEPPAVVHVARVQPRIVSRRSKSSSKKNRKSGTS